MKRLLFLFFFSAGQCFGAVHWWPKDIFLGSHLSTGAYIYRFDNTQSNRIVEVNNSSSGVISGGVWGFDEGGPTWFSQYNSTTKVTINTVAPEGHGFTVALDIYIRSLAQDLSSICNIIGSHTGGGLGWYLQITATNGTFSFGFAGSEDRAYVVEYAPTLFNIKGRHLIVWTRGDKAGDLGRFFLDGAEVDPRYITSGTKSHQAGGSITNPLNNYIGEGNLDNSDWVGCSCGWKQVGIWPFALNGSQVRTLWDITKGRHETSTDD